MADYDVVHDHILAMADALSGGIVRPVPRAVRRLASGHCRYAPHGNGSNPVTDMLGWALGAFGLMLMASGAWVLRKRSVRI